MHTYVDPTTLHPADLLTGIVRRLRALAWMGHDPSVVAVKYDADVLLVKHLCDAPAGDGRKRHYERSPLPADLWYAIATAYDDLSMSFGPSDHYRAKAKAAAWLPPLAWDDDALDDRKRYSNVHGKVDGRTPRLTRQTFDHAVVIRRISGDHSVPMRPADRLEAVRILHTKGMGTYGIADALGLHLKQIERDRRELGLEAKGTPAGYMNASHDPALFSRAKGIDRERNAARKRRRYAAERAREAA